MKKYLLLFICLIISIQLFSQAGWEIRVMPQAAIGTKNTFQRPNNSEGTRVYLNKDFKRKNDMSFSPRIEVEYRLKRNHFIATAALLKDKFEGYAGKNIMYDGRHFTQGSFVTTGYKFNTYRLGYRYRIVDKPRFAFELGATILLRDAYISMEDESKEAKYTNFGVAPLLSYSIEWKATEKFSVLSYGDAFAVKAGRAEDVFAGFKFQFSPVISGMAGYRLLEGGSDGDKVYTMSTFHFISLGVGFRF